MVARQLAARDISDPRVLAAMDQVPRHEFVPPALRGQAYRDHPLPIGQGQTISQPYIVAFMSQAVKLKPGDKVLEIGTGSGYQAAVLAAMGAKVYSVEIIPELAAQAEARLKRLGYAVQIRVGDGNQGWPQEAPFEAILVTAAARRIPPKLLEQLKPGGRMIIPVGSGPWSEELVLVKKGPGGKVTSHSLMAVRFVPLVGGDQPKP
ncbi:MAG: protein-L-isoaspartate(D-aspartate) O-methyltransferase [Proteobacteria bacterium]|nr:protein-L-isoaspartate(D-aspartate) O-methyltransferase [Pseudomonadota bacterium]MBU1451652.1 protein-L-isoaspartate(D-aspartate) O-methyltransferase [Pseudomonadota bacterium]MBU2470237.1 protein-L-isoaspartate(D-aspartate) O-methyltransferase [Pseudomonadota bacterium]MBU2518652.1 protein-L-isoaspartate(D-aspartate) O-methyltransferase [Pseudomonadota bacterium]